MNAKYLKYAIGEIVLVVIGILIALQINNWNTKRTSAKNTLIISKRLLKETKLNIEDLKIDIAKVNSSKNSAFTLLKLMGNDYTRYDKKRVDSLLLKIYRVYNHNFNAAVLDKAMNTGEITNFKNDSMEIVAYSIKNQINKYKFSESLLQNFNTDISNFWVDKVSIRQIDFNFSNSGKTNGPSQVSMVDNRAILASLFFENLVDDIFYQYESLEIDYINLNISLKLFVKLLEKEIATEND